MTAPPIGPSGTGLYSIEEAIRNASARLDGLEALGESLEEVSLAAGTAIGAGLETGGGAVGVATAEEVGTAAAGFTGWPIILVILAIIIVLRITESWLIYLAGKIPFVGTRAIQPAIKQGFYWLDKLENWIITWSGEQLKKVLHLARILIFALIGIDPAVLANLLGQVHQDHGAVTQAQFNTLERQIHYLRDHLGTVTYVTQDKTVVTPIPQNLWDQIHHLEAQVYLLHKDVTALAQQVQQALHTATSTQAQQVELAREIHDVRAVAVGWQDIAHELDQLGTQVTHFITSATGDLATLHQRQAQMEPLTLLLQPGISGLRNLRKLEDNMCQCPKLPNVPDLMPDRLAIYEFITNG